MRANVISQNKQRWSWLCLRTARDQFLQHFGKIGTGDILALAQEIEKEQERERVQKEEALAMLSATGVEEGSGSPMVTAPLPNAESEMSTGGSAESVKGAGPPVSSHRDGDIKMEER